MCVVILVIGTFLQLALVLRFCNVCTTRLPFSALFSALELQYGKKSVLKVAGAPT